MSNISELQNSVKLSTIFPVDHVSVSKYSADSYFSNILLNSTGLSDQQSAAGVYRLESGSIKWGGVTLSARMTLSQNDSSSEKSAGAPTINKYLSTSPWF